MIKHGCHSKGHFAQWSDVVIIQRGILSNGQPWLSFKKSFCTMVKHVHHAKGHFAQWSTMVIIQRGILLNGQLLLSFQ